MIDVCIIKFMNNSSMYICVVLEVAIRALITCNLSDFLALF